MIEERIEIACLLKYMSENAQPLGSGRAAEVLTAAGFSVSEATVGRLLRYMDSRGYTVREGFKGRILSPHGLDQVRDLLNAEDRRQYSERLAKMVRSHSLADLLETLVARRAIEKEIARLAALNITPEKAQKLGEIITEYRVADSDEVASCDVAFHRTLAKAAGNRVLKASLDLIRQDAQLSPVFGYIRTQLHGRVLLDHQRIYEAVVAKDPAAAEEAMINHIENLIEDVKKYWSRANR